MSNYPQYKDLLPFQYLRYVETETEPRIDTNKHEIKEENIRENSCALVVQESKGQEQELRMDTNRHEIKKDIRDNSCSFVV